MYTYMYILYVYILYIYNTYSHIHVHCTYKHSLKALLSGCQAWVLAFLRLVWRWVWRGTSRCLGCEKTHQMWGSWKIPYSIYFKITMNGKYIQRQIM